MPEESITRLVAISIGLLNSQIGQFAEAGDSVWEGSTLTMEHVKAYLNLAQDMHDTVSKVQTNIPRPFIGDSGPSGLVAMLNSAGKTNGANVGGFAASATFTARKAGSSLSAKQTMTV